MRTKISDRPAVPALNAYGNVDVRSGAPDGWCAVRSLPAPLDVMFALRLPVLRALVGFDRTYHGGYSPDVVQLVPECSWRVLASAEGRRVYERLGLGWDGEALAAEHRHREAERKSKAAERARAERVRVKLEAKRAAERAEKAKACRNSLAERKAQAARVAELVGAKDWFLTARSGGVHDHVCVVLPSCSSCTVQLGRPDEELVSEVRRMELAHEERQRAKEEHERRQRAEQEERRRKQHEERKRAEQSLVSPITRELGAPEYSSHRWTWRSDDKELWVTVGGRIRGRVGGDKARLFASPGEALEWMDGLPHTASALDEYLAEVSA